MFDILRILSMSNHAPKPYGPHITGSLVQSFKETLESVKEPSKGNQYGLYATRTGGPWRSDQKNGTKRRGGDGRVELLGSVLRVLGFRVLAF